MINPGLSFWAVIPAAGRGQRMGADIPKQYLKWGQRCILEHSLSCFLAHPGLKRLVVALAEGDHWWPQLPCARHPMIATVNGGRERADSVLAALQHLKTLGAQRKDWVLVHDAARPNLKMADLDHLLLRLEGDSVGGLLAVPVRDTLKRAGADGRIDHSLARNALWHALTPQMFPFGTLLKALSGALKAGVTVTDEASAMEWMGAGPVLVEGRWDNVKITRPHDLHWLQGLPDTPAEAF